MKISSILLLILTSFNLFATDYYCDPVNGSMSNNGLTKDTAWSSLQNVFANATAKNKLTSGDVVFLMNGAHGQPYIAKSNSGYITIKPASGAMPKISSVQMGNSKFWHFDGITFTSDGTGGAFNRQYIFYTDPNTTYVKITNCTFHSGTDSSNWSRADWYSNAKDAVMIRGDYLIFNNNTITNTYFAFEMDGDYAEVKNNVIDNFGADGIRALGSHAIYEDNIIRDAYLENYEGNIDGFPSNHDDAFQVYSRNDVNDGLIIDVVVSNNTIYTFADPITQAMKDDDLIGYSMQGIMHTDSKIEIFFIENNLVVTDHYHGITLASSKNCRIQNNTVLKTPNPVNPLADAFPWIQIRDSKGKGDPEGNIVRNNISNKVTTWTFDQAKNTTENNIDAEVSEYGSLFVDYNNFDLYLKSTSPAIDTGINTDLSTTDLAGNPRLIDGNNSGTAIVDVGCYEYGVDNTPPTFIANDTDLETQFVIVYGEKVTQATAENKSYYSLDGVVTVQSVSLDADGVTLTVTTSAMVTGTTYTVTVNGVEDLNGNAISNADDKFEYACDIISASSSEAGNPPENAFDDDMATKWAADGKGETITRSYCSTKTVGSVDIAFGFGDARTYTFTLFTSVDGITYLPSITRTSSGLSLDKEHFDIPDVSAKFFKIVGDGNNVNNWNNYVEIVYNEETDVIPPTFTANDTYFSTQLTIVFNEQVTQATAEDITNYSFDKGVTPISAVLDADGVTVVISTSAMSYETYTITVEGVEDEDGNATINATDQFTYICDAISASSYQDDGGENIHPPENAFDNDLATRWACLGVGEWILKSFCDAKTTSSLDIAFAFGNSNKYSFDIEVSNDGLTYTHLYTGESSGTSDAKETFTFTQTTARYFKIIANGNNNNAWNNYSEIEFHTVSAPVPATLVIIASPNDGYVSESGDIFTDNHMKVGKSYGDEAKFTSAIIPFKLPAIPSGYTEVKGARLHIYVPYGREYANTNIDLYGLQYKLANTSGVISASDYYTGSFGDRNSDVAIEENLFSKSNPIGVLDYSRMEISVKQVELSAYINAQYTAGAVAGDWVFLRLSVNNTSMTGSHFYAIDGADGESIDFSGTSRDNSPIKPAELYLNFANTIEVASTTTWDGTSWSNGVPDIYSDVVIAGNLTLGSDGANNIDKIISKSLVINSGSDVTINSGGTILVEDIFTVQGSVSILVESGGSFIAKDATVITFDASSAFTVKRVANASTYNYTYWSAPVSTTVELALEDTGSPIVYQYETSNYLLGDKSTEWQKATGNMTPGRGYIAKASSSKDPVIQTAVFSTNLANGINHETIIYPMSFGTEVNSDPYGWNLLGNPYPSAYSGHAFLQENWGNIVVGGALLFWTHNTSISDGEYSQDDYAYYNFSGGTAAISGGPKPDGKIASGQAFFVEARDVSMTFNPEFQIVSNEDTYNNGFYKTNPSKIDDISKDRIWFNVFNENAFSQILVGFFGEATNGIDNMYDANRIEVENVISFYSIVNQTNELAIQGSSSFAGNETIILGFNTNIDYETNFYIDIEKIEGMLKNSEVSVILKDNYLGTSHDLKKSNYEFTVAKSGKYNDRFEIVFRTGTLTSNSGLIQEIDVYPNPVVSNSFKIDLKGALIEENSIKLFNLNGVNIQFKQSLNSDNVEIQLPSNISSGVYVLQVLQGNGYIQKKIIVK